MSANNGNDTDSAPPIGPDDNAVTATLNLRYDLWNSSEPVQTGVEPIRRLSSPLHPENCGGTVYLASLQTTNKTNGVPLINCSATDGVVLEYLLLAQNKQVSCAIFFSNYGGCNLTGGSSSPYQQVPNLFSLLEGSNFANTLVHSDRIAWVDIEKMSTSPTYTAAIIAIVLPIVCAIVIGFFIFYVRFRGWWRRPSHAPGDEHSKKTKKTLAKNQLDKFSLITYPDVDSGMHSKLSGENSHFDTRSIHTIEFGETVDTREICTICLDSYEAGNKLRVLPCGHRFHSGCVDKWLLTRSVNCPLCRADLEHIDEV